MVEANDALAVSGFGGVLAGMVIGLYQVLLRDPMIFGESLAAPQELLAAHVHFFGLSLIVLFYALFIDALFDRYRGVTAGAAIIGQWGIPLVLIGVQVTGIEPLNAIQLPLAIINIAVAVAFLGAILRRGVAWRDAASPARHSGG